MTLDDLQLLCMLVAGVALQLALYFNAIEKEKPKLPPCCPTTTEHDDDCLNLKRNLDAYLIAPAAGSGGKV